MFSRLALNFALVLLVLVSFMRSAAAREETFDLPENGRVVISKNYDYNKKNIAISSDLLYWTESRAFHQFLSQEFMAYGFTVIERIQIDKVLGELTVDQTGLVKDAKEKVNKDSKSTSSGGNTASREFSKSELKKMGEMLGVSHLVIYGLLDDYYVYLRIVDLETAEIVVNAFVTGNSANREQIKDTVIIASLVKSIVASKNSPQNAQMKTIYIKYQRPFTMKETYQTFVDSLPPDKLIHKEDNGAFSYVIYLK